MFKRLKKHMQYSTKFQDLVKTEVSKAFYGGEKERAEGLDWAAGMGYVLKPSKYTWRRIMPILSELEIPQDHALDLLVYWANEFAYYPDIADPDPAMLKGYVITRLEEVKSSREDLAKGTD